MRKSITKLLLIVALFGGGIVHADYQQGFSGRTGTTHSGIIYCPANEKIEHFELAFDTSSASRANVPYNLEINGVVIYSNNTPSVLTSGIHAYATTSPVNHAPVDCFGQATWRASSTNANSIRVYYNDINSSTYAASPNVQLSEARNVSLTISGSQHQVGGNFRFTNSPFYLSTSTTSGGGGDIPSTIEVTSENDALINFALLFAILLAITFSVIVLLRPFYARK